MASNRPCDLPEQELIVKVGNKITTAMASDHPFYLSFKEVQKLFNSQRACAYSGEMFSTIGDITFERINPRLPYMKGNVVLVRKHINELKGNTIDRFIHQSGMSLDAQADLFAMIARSLRAEFNRTNHPRANAVNTNREPEVVPDLDIPHGRKMMLQMFADAKRNNGAGNVPAGASKKTHKK